MQVVVIVELVTSILKAKDDKTFMTSDFGPDMNRTLNCCRK